MTLVLALDENFVMPVRVLLDSVMLRADPARSYDIVILARSLRQEWQALFSSLGREGISVRVFLLDDWIKRHVSRSLHTSGQFTEATYYRLFIPLLFQRYEKVLYLDGDTLCLGDIAELFDTDLGDRLIGAVRNIKTMAHDQKRFRHYVASVLKVDPASYVNAGVLLCNVARMNEEGFGERLLSRLPEADAYRYLDQDVLNAACGGRVQLLDLKWNLMWHVFDGDKPIRDRLSRSDRAALSRALRERRIIHYSSGRKPWNTAHSELGALWMEQAVRTLAPEDWAFLPRPTETAARNETADKEFPYSCASIGDYAGSVKSWHKEDKNPDGILSYDALQQSLRNVQRQMAELGASLLPAFPGEDSAAVFFACDGNFAKFLSVTLISLATHAAPHRYYDLIVLDGGLSGQDKDVLSSCLAGRPNMSLRFVDMSFADSLHAVHYLRGHYTLSTYYRLYAHILMQHYDKAVYLDSDLVCVVDVYDLYKTDIKNEYIAACRDYAVMYYASIKSDTKKYLHNKLKLTDIHDCFNAGVLVCNLKIWREVEWIQKLDRIRFLLPWPRTVDQDILHLLCKDHVLYLDNCWNDTSGRFRARGFDVRRHLPAQWCEELLEIERSAPKIIHYNGSPRPWEMPSKLRDSVHFWRYARLSPYYEHLMESMAFYHANTLHESLKRVLPDILQYRKIFVLHKIFMVLAFFSRGTRRAAYAFKRRNYADRLKAIQEFLVPSSM